MEPPVSPYVGGKEGNVVRDNLIKLVYYSIPVWKTILVSGATSIENC